MKKERGYGMSEGGWKRVAFGIGIGLATMLASTGGFAWLIQKELMGWEHMGLAAAAVLLLGGFLGAVCAGGGEGSLIRTGAVEAGLAAILLLVNLALYDGRMQGILPGAAALLGSGAAAALVRGSGGERKGRKRRYRKYGNR